MLTIGDLRDKIAQIPEELNDMPVHYQRIEDIYFTKHHWHAVKIDRPDYGDGIVCEYIRAWDADIMNGIFVIDAHY